MRKIGSSISACDTDPKRQRRPLLALRVGVTAAEICTHKRSREIAALCLVLLVGCSSRDIETQYGRRVGSEPASVNGTGVLADMFQRAGHAVFTWQSLSPKLSRRADCIVWFPDDICPPDRKTRGWLEHWLEARPGRTLVYVGRDFDAAPGYWDAVLPGARQTSPARSRPASMPPRPVSLPCGSRLPAIRNAIGSRSMASIGRARCDPWKGIPSGSTTSIRRGSESS